jgi:hypothetical protein
LRREARFRMHVPSDTGGGDNGTARPLRDKLVSSPVMAATGTADARSWPDRGVQVLNGSLDGLVGSESRKLTAGEGASVPTGVPDHLTRFPPEEHFPEVA